MTHSACPHCGHTLVTNALTNEYMPCGNCGSVHSAQQENPEPTPEHQEQINKQKLFEIGTVVILVILGLGYFAISNRGLQITGNTIATVDEATKIILNHDFNEADSSEILSQQFHTFHLQEPLLQHEIDIVSNRDSDEVVTIIMAVTLPSGKPFPPNDIAEKSIQRSFNMMIVLSEALIPGSSGALQKAAETVTSNNGERIHNKGVAQTPGGWKVTYIAYREYEKTDDTTPLILFIYQRLANASTPETEAFNHIMYQAINNGTDIKMTLAQNESLNTENL